MCVCGSLGYRDFKSQASHSIDAYGAKFAFQSLGKHILKH